MEHGGRRLFGASGVDVDRNDASESGEEYMKARLSVANEAHWAYVLHSDFRNNTTNHQLETNPDPNVGTRVSYDI